MLKEKIGVNAGLVWDSLIEGELDLKSIKKVTKLTEKDMNLALGWLAREGKINFRESEGDVFVRLA